MAYLTRDEAKADALFDVEVKGKQFLCRVASVQELFVAGVIVPPIVTLDMSEDERTAIGVKTAVESYQKIHADLKTATAVLALTMVRPALWTGKEDECPDDQVTALVLGPYRDELIDEIMPKLGYGESRRKAVDFRHSVGDGAVAVSDGAGEPEGSARAS